MKTLAFTLAVLASTFAVADPGTSIIAEWNFNNPQSWEASTGSGIVSLLGGVVSTNFQGSPTDPDTPNGAISLKTFPTQGTSPQTAGLEFTTSAKGWRDLGFRFEVRASATASRWLRVQAAADDGPMIDTGFFELLRDGVFTNLSVDLSGYPALNGARQVSVRIVSDFGHEGEYVGVKPKTDGSNSYSAAGTWRFDRAALVGLPDNSSSGAIPIVITQAYGQLTLSWPEELGEQCSLWRAASLSGPWDSVPVGTSAHTHSEVILDEPQFFRITSP